MDISVTHFKSIFDNKTDKVSTFKNFDQFEASLYKISEQPRADKKDATLISPAMYKPETTRSNDNVVGWSSWCAVDIDDHTFRGNLKDELDDNLGDTRYVCYSTASSTSSFPKFRLVFPLKHKIGKSEIKPFWYALNTSIGNLADQQTKDLSRMYYIPGTYAGANNFIFSNSGDYIDPTELMIQHEYIEQKTGTFLDRLPENFRQEVINYRKDQMDNINVHWSTYRDCPFFPKNLATEYQAISNTGWYHKMYQIMVAIAGNAVKSKYPITPEEITTLCRQFDTDTGNWYQHRPLNKEADRAIEYVYKNL